MRNKIKTLKSAFITGLTIGLFVSAMVLIFGYLLIHPVGEGSVVVYDLIVEYGNGRRDENISCTDKAFEGSLIFLRFFYLDNNSIYQIWVGYRDITLLDKGREIVAYYSTTPIGWIYNITYAHYWISFESEGFIALIRVNCGWNQSLVGMIYGMTSK